MQTDQSDNPRLIRLFFAFHDLRTADRLALTDEQLVFLANELEEIVLTRVAARVAGQAVQP